jgi:hypothetical protein
MIDARHLEWLRELNKFRKLVMHPVSSIASAKTAAEMATFATAASLVIGELQAVRRRIS